MVFVVASQNDLRQVTGFPVVLRVLCIFRIPGFCQIRLLQIFFFPVFGLSFHSLNNVFLRVVFNFNEIHLTNFFFHVVPKNSLSDPGSPRFLCYLLEVL